MSSPAQAVALIRAAGKRVLTFLGYSGAGYEHPAQMLETVQAILSERDPATTLVNAGATSDGIGAIYPLAHRMGFETSGIVSTQAREAGVSPSPGVDRVAMVDDALWGGVDPATGLLSPTSQAMVKASDEMICIGGGPVARDELSEARAAGLSTRFIPADHCHARAVSAARKKGEPEPRAFKGAAHTRFAD